MAEPLTQKMNLDSDKSKLALSIVEKLTKAGYHALFAGGCVRDHLLGFVPTDYDIATSATPDDVEKLFEKTIPVGRQFGVMLVIMRGMQFEVATFRTEGGYQDGRHPTIINFSNAREDASRRDFTINGLFYDPLTHQVIDYVDGQADIKQKLIRCIGDPSKRFNEDKLRLLRAIRFASRLDFTIEERTWSEIKRLAKEITNVSNERIRDEIDKILTGHAPAQGLQLLINSEIGAVLWPFITPAIIGRFKHAQKRSVSLACALLLMGHTKQEIESYLRQFRYSNNIIQDTLSILDLEEKIHHIEGLRSGKMKLILGHKLYPEARAAYSSNANNSPAIIQKLNDIENKWCNEDLCPKPFLKGEDLINLGISTGPELGKILEEAYLLQLDGIFNERSQALLWVQTQI